jgi:hypothetical protein
VAVNLLSRRGGIGPVVARLRQAFDGVLVRPACKAGNVVVLAAREAGSHLLSLVPPTDPDRAPQ